MVRVRVWVGLRERVGEQRDANGYASLRVRVRVRVRVRRQLEGVCFACPQRMRATRY